MSELDKLDFDFIGARATDPDTSWEAAMRRLSGKSVDRKQALLILASRGEVGLTDFQLADIMGRQQNSAGKRRTELRDLGLVEDSGRRHPAPSGSSAIVWRITELGRQMAEALS